MGLQHDLMRVQSYSGAVGVTSGWLTATVCRLCPEAHLVALPKLSLLVRRGQQGVKPEVRCQECRGRPSLRPARHQLRPAAPSRPVRQGHTGAGSRGVREPAHAPAGLRASPPPAPGPTQCPSYSQPAPAACGVPPLERPFPGHVQGPCRGRTVSSEVLSAPCWP